MVFIHGGAFLGGNGSSRFAGPDYLVEQDVVFVAFNYRCGAFGFLSLETEEVPGNAGLKDQTLALEWIRDNIHSFGGDLDNVTIFGISAGGASVSYHLISPLSKGLFHKAILHGGYAVSPWAVQESPRANAFQLAQALGCDSDKLTAVLKFLQQCPADKSWRPPRNYLKTSFFENLGLMFVPSVEVANSSCFLPEAPNSLLEKGEYNRVPVILGNCLKEGSVVSMFGGVNDKVISNVNEKHELLVPTQYLPLDCRNPDKKKAAEKIWRFYMKGEPLTWDNVNNYLRYQSDYLFNNDMLRTRKILLKTSKFPVYTYVFSNNTRCFCKFFAMLNPNDDKAIKLMNEDTCHGSDSAYLFNTTLNFPMPSIDTEQAACIKRHTSAWANFASTGDPNSEVLGAKWEPDSEESPSYMDIGESGVSNSGVPFLDRFQFWNRLISTYNPKAVQSKY